MRRLLVLLLALVLAGPAIADARLVLKDGTKLDGKSVQKKDDLYLLERADGSTVPVPAELVAQLQLLEVSGAPTGLEPAGPKSLAGPAWAGSTPPFRDQLKALKQEPYVAPLPAVDPVWKPTSDWTDQGKAALMPVHWSYGIDAQWTPKPAYTKASDVTNFRPTHWFVQSINPVWQPVDSWGETVWFRPLVATPDK